MHLQHGQAHLLNFPNRTQVAHDICDAVHDCERKQKGLEHKREICREISETEGEEIIVPLKPYPRFILSTMQHALSKGIPALQPGRQLGN